MTVTASGGFISDSREWKKGGRRKVVDALMKQFPLKNVNLSSFLHTNSICRSYSQRLTLYACQAHQEITETGKIRREKHLYIMGIPPARCLVCSHQCSQTTAYLCSLVLIHKSIT